MLMLGHLGSLISSFGQKQLSVFEMELKTVKSNRLPNNSKWSDVAISRGPLSFTGTQLAHAVIKADFLDQVNPLLPGIGFILQSHHILDWKRGDLCLKPGGNRLLSDFAQTCMTGRIGQGLALLFSHSKGYRFTTHLSSHLASVGISRIGYKGKSLRAADFVCDESGGTRALVEAKASVSQPRNIPSAVKGLLKKTLNEQITPWMNKTNPVATKSFVVSSYLREGTNTNCDPSTLVFVDPESGDEGKPFDLSLETVRRENFAAWLAAMGLFRHAERLRSRESAKVERVQFAIFKMGEREIAFPAIFGFPFAWDFVLPPINTVPVIAAGIHLDALKAISQAAKGDGTALLEYQGFDEAQESQRDNASYSMFPDGTFFGEINSRSFSDIGEFEL